MKSFSRRYYPETRLFFYNFFVFQVQVDGLIRNLLIYTQYTSMLYTPQDLWPIHDHALKLLRISRGDQRSMDLWSIALCTPSPVKGKECRESVSRFYDTWFQKTQLGRRCIRVVLFATYPGATGPQSFLFRECVRQPDAAVPGLASGRRKLLYHYRGIRVYRGQGPSTLFHGRRSHTMQEDAPSGWYLDVLRELRELHFVWKLNIIMTFYYTDPIAFGKIEYKSIVTH